MTFIITFLSRLSGKFYSRLSSLLSCTLLGKWIVKEINRFKFIQVIKSSDRISSLDIFRALAIIGVIFYHFNHFIEYGYLGVDLFFVISGFLVGGILTKEFEKNQGINIPKFLLQRGFKIWPSYYFFLIAGSVLVILFYRNSHPDHIIPLWDIARFALFYQNYVDYPDYWSFGHVWSLCVEEHFYIALPIIFFTIQKLVGIKYRIKTLYVVIIVAIISGIAIKFISFYYHKDADILKTHNRIDALALGVLMNLLITHYGPKLKQIKYLYLLTLLGFSILMIIIAIHKNTSSEFFRVVVIHSIVPICCFLMILGVYYQDFSKFYLLRMIGYFSYNWYLWHQVFVYFMRDNVTEGRLGFSVYAITSFIMAVLATVLIEEPFLEIRKKVLPKLFKKK